MNEPKQDSIQKIIVIGSGNAFNTDGRANAAYLIETVNGKKVLMDCGPTTLYRLKQMGMDSNEIDCILISHFHGDHIGGLPFLLLDMDVLNKRKKDVVIAGPPGISSTWKLWYELGYGEHKLSFLIKNIEIQRGENCLVNGIDIHAYPVNHRPESIGFRITDSSGKIISYTGDAALDHDVLNLIDGADVAILELSLLRQSKPPLSHISLAEIRENQNKLNVKRLILSHTSDEIVRDLEDTGEAAYDGMEILLNPEMS